MIKVNVLYPNTEGSTFDLDYYLNNHTPMLLKKMGPAIKGISIERGLGGMAPGSPPDYRIMCHLLFDSVEAFQKAFEPVAAEVLADIPKYTNVQAVVQISEVLM